MTVFAVVLESRQSGVSVEVWGNVEAAMSRCRTLVNENAKFPESIRDESVKGRFLCITYGDDNSESCWVQVQDVQGWRAP